MQKKFCVRSFSHIIISADSPKDTIAKKILEGRVLYLGGRGHSAVYYTGPQSFIIHLLNNFMEL